MNFKKGDIVKVNPIIIPTDDPELGLTMLGLTEGIEYEVLDVYENGQKSVINDRGSKWDYPRQTFLLSIS
jgi:hypothetical protein